MSEEKFIEIANRYKDTIYRVALNYLRSPYDAEDVIQDVLMKLYTSKKEFESDDYIRYWLIRVTINHCKNVLRMPWRKRNVPLTEISNHFVFDNVKSCGLLQEVMELSEKYRVILYLFYYEEYTVKEISELLGIKESAVTTRLSRGRRQLKLKVKEVPEYE